MKITTPILEHFIWISASAGLVAFIFYPQVNWGWGLLIGVVLYFLIRMILPAGTRSLDKLDRKIDCLCDRFKKMPHHISRPVHKHQTDEEEDKKIDIRSYL